MIVNAIFKKIMHKNMQKNLNVILIKTRNYLAHNKNNSNLNNNYYWSKKKKKKHQKIFIIVRREMKILLEKFNKLKYFKIVLLRYLFYFY